MNLPAGFLFGASTAAHQVEGNNLASDFWWAENQPNSYFTERSGDACDSFERWREDIDLVVEAGMNAYRFSVEWARIEPERDHVSASAVQHYVRMVEYARERGIEPVVTLHHFTSPLWFTRSGSWTAPDAVERFLRYIDAIRPVLDAGVARCVTINEPNMVCIMATIRQNRQNLEHGLGRSLPSVDAPTRDALIRVHAAAVEALHAQHPGLAVGWSVAMQSIRSVDGGEENAQRYRDEIETPFVLAARGDDFFGVQAYSRNLFDAAGKVDPPQDELTDMGWHYFPPALGLALRDAAEILGPDVPLLVTENGIATTDDLRRIEYTTGALAAMEECMADGITVLGYLHWSLLDNYEWGTYRPRFGLVAVDLSTFERTPKPSLAWLGGIARTGVLPSAE